MKIEITISRLPDAPDDPIVAAAGQPQANAVCSANLVCPSGLHGTTGSGRTPAVAFRVALANILRELLVSFADDSMITTCLEEETGDALDGESTEARPQHVALTEPGSDFVVCEERRRTLFSGNPEAHAVEDLGPEAEAPSAVFCSIPRADCPRELDPDAACPCALTHYHLAHVGNQEQDYVCSQCDVEPPARG